jgi:hypothetical protein
MIILQYVQRKGYSTQHMCSVQRALQASYYVYALGNIFMYENNTCYRHSRMHL